MNTLTTSILAFIRASTCYQHVKEIADLDFQKDTSYMYHELRDLSLILRKPSPHMKQETLFLLPSSPRFPKHSGPASQPLPEKSAMQLVRGPHGGVLRRPWPLHDARLNVALCIPNVAMR